MSRHGRKRSKRSKHSRHSKRSHGSRKCEKHCDEPIVIESSPYIIHQSGNYCLTDDLQVSSFGIKVLASNVTIDLSNHTITLISDSANGVVIDGVSRVIVQNGLIVSSIRSTDESNIGVNVNNATDVELVNMMISETGYGVYISGSTDVTMSDLNLYNNGAGEVRAVDSTGIVLEDSQLDNVVNDLKVAGVRFDTTDNIVIQDTRLHNSDINARTGNGILVDGVNSVNEDDTYIYGLFQFGTNTPTGTDPNIRGFNDGIVQNSVFANVNSSDVGSVAVFATAGDNWQFDNCVLNATDKTDFQLKPPYSWSVEIQHSLIFQVLLPVLNHM